MEIFNKDNYLSKENPINEIWDLIFLNCTKKYIDNSFDIKITSLKILKYFLDQSFELYKSSTTVSNNTSPLLQFYSFSNLAKLLIVLRQVKKGPESLNQAHGLKIILNKKREISLNDIDVKIENNGTFTELLQAFNRNETIDDYIGVKFNLRELIDHYIDLYDFLENKSFMLPIYIYRNFENKPNDPYSEKDKKYTLEIFFINLESIKQFQIISPEIDFTQFKKRPFATTADPSGIPYRIYYNKFDEIPKILFERNYSNERFIVKPFAKEKKSLLLYQIEIQYLISFLLSNLVRYYPKEWTFFLSNTELSWEIEKTINYMNRSYPNNILNFINKSYNVVLNPGILVRT